MLLTHAFEQLECIAVEFRTHWTNVQSHAAIERLGAKQDGVPRNHSRMPDGSLRDTVVFSTLESEWPAARNELRRRLGVRAAAPSGPCGVAPVAASGAGPRPADDLLQRYGGPARPAGPRRCGATGYVKAWPQRIWAVEPANGAGRPLAQRQLVAIDPEDHARHDASCTPSNRYGNAEVGSATTSWADPS